MSDSPLSIEHDYHAPGEYRFTPGRLTISVGFSRTPLEMRYDGEYWRGTSGPGDIKVMPAGQERVFQHSVGCRFACLVIDESKLMLEGPRRELRARALLRDEPIRHLLNALWAQTRQGPLSALFEDAIARAMIARLHALEGHRETIPKQCLSPRASRRVREYIDAHLAEDITVAELAQVAGLSTAHFAVLFRNSFGEPPHRYIVRLRVERARDLLMAGVDPAHAAVAVGFYDHSHLARHLRRLLGTSPSQLRPRKGKS